MLESARTKKVWGEEFRLRSSPAEFENKAIIARLRKPETVLLGLDFTTESSVTLEALGDLLLFSSPHYNIAMVAHKPSALRKNLVKKKVGSIFGSISVGRSGS